ncbi:MAG: hypothetical protein NC293_08220 [Roseburia sp.]|nr:hypothetical protein [Roseburia sp.]
MKKSVYRQIRAIFCLAAAALFFAGCGGEYENSSGNAGVSGGAVSVSAVSGQAASASAVSGQAVSGSDGYHRYTYCSDWNLYYIRDYYTDKAKIVERNLEDGSEREISVDGVHEICYADNDWVYYTKMRYEEDSDGEVRIIVREVWRAPVSKSSFCMDQKAEELVLSADNDMGLIASRSHVGTDHRGVQCDGRYIVYEGGDWAETDEYTLETFLRVYDIRTGKYVCEEIFHTDNFDIDMRNPVLCGDSIFLYDNEKTELVRIKLETGETMTVASKDYQRPIVPDTTISTASEEDVFWINHKKDNSEEVWQYHLSENRKICLITDAEFRKALEKNGLLTCSLGGKKAHTYYCEACFVRANRLYVQIEIDGEGSQDKVCRNWVIFSKELGAPDAPLVFEKKLNECLANPERRQKFFTKKYDGIYGIQPHKEKACFKSRGFCVSMTEKECLLYVENEDEKKNMPASYDFETGEMRFLEKGEDWPSCYLYDRNNRVLTGDPGEFMERYDTCDKMPNNYDALEEE